MKLVIMQPSYLPWLGYFDLFLSSDLFLVYDNVQFDKDGWRNRNKIKTSNGPLWLTVPVLTTGMNKPTNKDIQINPREPWARKHLKSIEQNYRKAPYFNEIYPLLEKGLTREWKYLLELNMYFIETINQYLGIQTAFKFASEVKLDLPEGKNEKLVALCRHLKADEFYEPAGGKGYIDPGFFEQNGIRLSFQDYQHPVYPQLNGAFVPNLSVIDLLFNRGRDSLAAIQSGNTAAVKKK